jgi:microsomal epoxide hydrolase
MNEPRPYTIDIPDAELTDLQDRLRRTRWPADPGNPEGRYGATAEWMHDLVTYWSEGWDWRAVETSMNSYEQYVVEIDGVPVHYMRVPGRGPNPLPLIL